MGESRRPGWAGAARPTSPLIPVELLVFGAWAVSAPYVGRAIGLVVDTTSVVEVVDHVVPGSAVLALALIALITGRRSFLVSMAVLAAGLWMTASHLPLLVQAAHGEADLGASLFHFLPGAVILVLGVVASFVDGRLESEARLDESTQSGHIDPNG